MNKKFVVGITGGIASGKSTVANIWKDLGATLINSDIVARQFLNDKNIISKLSDAFGDSIIDSDRNIIKPKFRDILFSDINNVKISNAIMWPPTINKISEIIKLSTGLVVLESALLFESGLDIMVDYVVTVSIDSDTRYSRVLSRDGTTSHIDTILKTQWTDTERERHSNVIIHNNGSLEDLKKNATIVYNSF